MLKKAQRIERIFAPSELSGFNESHCIHLPVAFIYELTFADSLNAVLDTVAKWVGQIFEADRASISIQKDAEHLQLYAINGNQAIPMEFALPIAKTFIGRAFESSKLMICDDTTVSDEEDCIMLSSGGLGSCMDAPMIHCGVTIGTLNVADTRTHCYSKAQAIQLQCLANWIALNIRLHLQLKEMNLLASTDELTGTFNRRRFTFESHENMQRFLQSRIPYVIGILDVDLFKDLNDRYGHTTGDQVLKDLTANVRQHIRKQDFLARIGGEEFAIILPACVAEEAEDIFERVRESIEQHTFSYDAHRIHYTVSIGYAEVGLDDQHYEDVFKRADKALYKAKANNRNQVCLGV
ncbi:diguanylate cyclase (GGDEF) domain-containing protein [Acinetobacter marinus]|uniref:diguanylate cyclase n=1 Tax=Acinetobacter marinus TaxID=281375 RepID=A0A1G6J0A5_9GAMM|nr:sensor domain-containing diguanylate cyclase [Acinetobacter marinus]SDC12179.1 diguanylate cyclase (GGDEF) domain-containing protein [Acinetobacter marinus]